MIEDDDDDEVEATPDAHGMDPVAVLGLVRALGGVPPRTYVIGCEPQTRMTPEDEDLVVSLAEPVRAALDPAVRLVKSLLEDIQQEVRT